MPYYIRSQSNRMGNEDPKGKSIEKIREIRDEIEERVKGLITTLPKEN